MDALFQGTLVKSNRIIYTPSNFARTNLLHLQEVGQLQAQKPHTSERKNLASYLFFTIIEGSGVLVYNGFVLGTVYLLIVENPILIVLT